MSMDPEQWHLYARHLESTMDPCLNEDICRIQQATAWSNTAVPPAAECELLKNDIERTEAEIDTLDDEIARLISIRNGKNARVYILRTAVAPHKSLTTEILRLIFEYTLSTSDSDRHPITIPNDLSRRKSPWNLRQVCSTWRKIALQNPRLWNHILISSSAENLEEFVENLRVSDKILPRSGPIHFELSLNVGWFPASNRLNYFFQHFDQQECNRISSLKLRVHCGYEAFRPIYFPGARILPSLQSIQLICHADSDIDEDEIEGGDFEDCGLDFFEAAKQLNSYRFVGDSTVMANAFRIMESPWASSRLTSLELEYQPIASNLPALTLTRWSDFCRALESCMNLKDLSLRLALALDHGYLGFKHIILPELTSLTLCNEGPPFVLNSFILPSLSRLTYQTGVNFGIDDLINFLQRSQCALESFLEEGRPEKGVPTPIGRMEWVKLVQLLQSVKEVKTDTAFDEIDLAQLGTGEIWPSAERITVPVEEPFSLEKLESRIIGSRKEGSPSKLRRVCLRYRKDHGRAHKLRRLSELGRIRALAEQSGSEFEYRPTFTKETTRRRII